MFRVNEHTRISFEFRTSVVSIDRESLVAQVIATDVSET
jgi:hypothetical protein